MENENGYVAEAIDKHTKLIKTCYLCGTKEEATKIAKYYRGIGYNAKVCTYEEHVKRLDKEAEERYNNRCYEDMGY